MDNQSKTLTRFAKSRRKWRKERIDKGLCVSCGRIPSVCASSHFCQRCKEVQKQYRADYRLKRAQAGLCVRCGKQNQSGELKQCKDCLFWHRLDGLRSAGVPELEIQKAIVAWDNFNGKCHGCGGVCGQWCLDHDHVRLVFRGILGDKCNRALGQLQDAPTTLRRLADYVERFL
jgi:hypothetical protein